MNSSPVSSPADALYPAEGEMAPPPALPQTLCPQQHFRSATDSQSLALRSGLWFTPLSLGFSSRFAKSCANTKTRSPLLPHPQASQRRNRRSTFRPASHSWALVLSDPCFPLCRSFAASDKLLPFVQKLRTPRSLFPNLRSDVRANGASDDGADPLENFPHAARSGRWHRMA